MPKQYGEEVRQLIVKVIDYFQREKINKGPLLPLNAIYERAEAALGISVSTLKRVKSEVRETESTQNVKRPKPVTDVTPANEDGIRRLIYEMYEKKVHVTLDTILENLKTRDIFNGSRSSLRTVLKRLGFRWKKDDSRVGLMELPHVVLSRFSFLEEYVRRKKAATHQFVYLDETWIFENGSAVRSWQDGTKHTVRSIKSESSRYIILHAGSQNGFIAGAELIFSSKTKTGDYHGEMNQENFLCWFEEQLLKNLEEPSTIIMDNASYHSTLEHKTPNLSWTKEKIQEWLTQRNISFNRDAFKKELLKKVMENKPPKRFVADVLAHNYGHTVLRLPPYHCIFNPIENIWGIAKTYYNQHIGRDGYGREKCLAMWKEALAAISATTWKNSIDHTEKIIEDYWDKEVMFEREEASPLIIEIGHGGDSDSEDTDIELHGDSD